MDPIRLTRHGITAAFSLLLFTVAARGVDYEEAAELVASTGVPDEFGTALALDGETLLIGAEREDGARGAVYVFRREGAAWLEAQRLVASDGTPNDGFGSAVALSGDKALVAAPGAEGKFGAVYAFRHDGTEWLEEQTILAGNETFTFGEALAMDGDVAVIGGDLFMNRLEVHRFDGTTWNFETELADSAPGSNSEFGHSVSLRGDVVWIGNPSIDPSGRAHVFSFDGSVWTEEQTVTASDASSGDQFGRAVAYDTDENLAIVGADRAAYVFAFDGTTWTETQKLTTTTNDASFGRTVATDGRTILVGARGEGTSGALYVFEHDGTEWIETQRITPSNPTAGSLGTALVFAEGLAFAGAPASGSDPGSVFAYSERSCATGNVNEGNGITTNVLFVNGSSGGPSRAVEVVEGDFLTITLLRPLAGGSGRFVLHADEGDALLPRRDELPFEIGTTCFPFLDSNDASPVIIANGIGKTGIVGESSFYGSPTQDPEAATTELLYPDLPAGTALTLQGLILDPASPSPKSASVTNAVTIHVVPQS